MTNKEIARILRNVAAAYIIKDDKKFRFQIIAYQKAADIIDHSVNEMYDLFKENKLDTLPGIGPSIKSHLEELFTHGKVKHFEEVLSGVPQSVFALMEVPGLGPKRAFKLVSEYKLSNPKTVISDLEKIAKEGRIENVEGFGEKSQQDILRSIREYSLGKTKARRMVLPYATDLANKMIDYLKQSKYVLQAHPLGSLRRKMATVGDIDISAATNQPAAVLDHFVLYPGKERVIEHGERTASILTTSGAQIDLMLASPEGYGALLQHFTGSKAHNVHLREYALSRGLSLSEYGIKKRDEKGGMRIEKCETEENFYKALGMDWIPPEMREDTGEIELAVKHKIPKLVELSDIKGDFHLHSSYPIEPSHDTGKNSMEEMIQKAISLKYNYLGFSEHNPSISRHNFKQSYEIIKKRSIFIEQLNLRYIKNKKSIHIFSLLEVDILPNGDLAVDDSGLELLDGAIVAVHTVFDMGKAAMTKRVLKGLSHPKAKILAHPTGRLLNQRPGYELDWDKIFDFCKVNNKALEINSWYLRLDLTDVLVREAIKRGVTLVINTDSHAVSQMGFMEYGVSVARRGWARSDDILNTKTYNEIKEWFGGR